MGFRARIVYQKIDRDERVKMVVLLCMWEWRCDGGGCRSGWRLGLVRVVLIC